MPSKGGDVALAFARSMIVINQNPCGRGKGVEERRRSKMKIIAIGFI